MPEAFFRWKSDLIAAAGSCEPAVSQLGDYVLELFWRDGCQPTVASLIAYSVNGLEHSRPRRV